MTANVKTLDIREFVNGGKLLLEPGDAELASVVDRLLPGREGPRYTLASRRAVLRRILQVATGNRDGFERTYAGLRRAEEEARQLARAARAERDGVAARYHELLDGDTAMMRLVTQLALAAQDLPKKLVLSHPEEGPPEATFMLAGLPVEVKGLRVEIAGGAHALTAASGGDLTPQQSEALATYFRVVRALGTTNPEERLQQLAAILDAGLVEGITAAAGCGRCEACSELAESASRAHGDMAMTVAALAAKAARPCPPENLRRKGGAVRVKVRLGK